MEPSQSVYITLIESLASNPAMLVLALLLMGVLFIAYKTIPHVFEWFKSVSTSAEKVANSLEKMREDISQVKEDMHELNKDIAIIAREVSSHDVRLTKLEGK